MTTSKTKSKSSKKTTVTSRGVARRAVESKIAVKAAYKHYSSEQVELADRVANDIVEQINSGQSIAELRYCVSIWADRASDAIVALKALESRMKIFQIGFEVMQTVVKPNTQ